MSQTGGVEAKIIVSGVNEYDTGVEGFKDKIREACRSIVSKGALIIADSAKEQYRARPSGSRRVSQGPKYPGRVYYAGAPDFPAVPPNPTIRTGNTRNSIRPRSIEPVGTDGWMSTTGPSVNYERYPELGTKFIRVPFPVIRMGVENSEDRLQALAEGEWAAAIEEAA